MRRWIYLIAGVFVFTTQAGQLPLTVGEIGLMLRAGYSSQTLMQELANRHLADTLDDAKEQTLTKAGASPELIAAIKSGAYSLSADKTAAALEQMEAQAQQHAAAADAARKSAAAYEAEILKKRSARPSTLNSGGAEAVSEFLKTDLIRLRGGDPIHADDGALANKKLIAFYFSAEWCAPCRKFTPQLVEYYKRVSPEHPEFEIVFYSSDKSQYAMEKYMRDENMPWLAVDYTKLKEKAALKKNAGDGIPSLVLVDSSGNVISSSYADGKYIGPQKVLADLDGIFSGKRPSRVADAR